jgi:hypothetical protein
MKRQAIVLLGMLVFPALGGCEGDGPTLAPPEPEVPPDVERDTTAPIQTDTTFYTLREDWEGLATEIALRWENQAEDTLYITVCFNFVPTLEKKVDGAWEEYWNPGSLACSGPPIVIEPGAVLVDTVHVWGALPGDDVWPQFKSDDVEGVYRIVIHSVFWQTEDWQGVGDQVPLRYRVSNPFVLDDPRR